MSNELTLFDYGTLPVNDAMELSAIKERVKIRLKRTAEDIIEIGKDLIEAKRIAGHGHFETWLNAEFEMSQMSANRLMQVGNTFGNSKSNNLLDLKPSALYELAAPSMPDEVRTEIIERVEAGESVNLAEIQRLKKEAVELAQDKESLQNDLIAKTEQAESAEAKVRFQALTVEAVEKQNDEMRNRDQQLIDAKVGEERAKLILENQQAIAENKRIAENAQGEIERLKREQVKAIADGVARELQNFDREIEHKEGVAKVIEIRITALREVELSLEREVGHLQTHKKAIAKIKDNLSFLTVAFSDAFETETMPSETVSDWTAIYDALNKLVTQMREWRTDSALIGELVD